MKCSACSLMKLGITGFLYIMCSYVSVLDCFSKGGCPTKSSKATIPIAQASTAAVYSSIFCSLFSSGRLFSGHKSTCRLNESAPNPQESDKLQFTQFCCSSTLLTFFPQHLQCLIQICMDSRMRTSPKVNACEQWSSCTSSGNDLLDFRIARMLRWKACLF